MSPNIYRLHPQPHRPVGARQTAPRLYQGRLYPFTVEPTGLQQLPPGMVGGYHISSHAARVLPVAVVDGRATAYPYDTEAGSLAPGWRTAAVGSGGTAIAVNHLSLSHTEVVEPGLVQAGSQTWLRMAPQFRLHYHTEAYAAELGVVHRVQSQRYALLGDGTQVTLQETGEPVLYLPAESADAVACITVHQGLDQHQDHHYSLTVQQAIPARMDGSTVASLTVLEQYQSYFLQRECSDAPVIWTPALAPITWGWSIRVGRRADGEWGILRRKLVLPTLGHDGLEFPTWEQNHVALLQTSGG